MGEETGLPGSKYYFGFVDHLRHACQPDDGEAPHVIPCVAQTKDEARAELDTLGADPAWIERMTAALED